MNTTVQPPVIYTQENVLKAYQRAILGDGYNVSFIAWLDLNGIVQTEGNGYEVENQYDEDLDFHDNFKPSETDLKLAWTITILETRINTLAELMSTTQDMISIIKSGYLQTMEAK